MDKQEAKKLLDELGDDVSIEDKEQIKMNVEWATEKFRPISERYLLFAYIGVLAGEEPSVLMEGAFMAGICAYRDWLLDIRHVDVLQLEGRI
jgi:hypothetical protein